MSWKHRKKLLKVDQALEKNEYVVADQLLTEILQESSDFIEALLHRSLVRLRLDRSEEALADAEECIKRRPENGVAHMILGEVFLYQKRYLDAFQSLRKAVQIEKDNGRAFYFLARASLGLGKREEAADYLEAAMEFEKDFVMARVAVDQIKI